MIVQILISTYNGEKYIAAQLNSILEQDYPNIEILIRDDGSTDSTTEIIESFIKIHNNIKLIKGSNIGFVSSFFTLLELTQKTDFIAFCDQDDIWLKEKISRALTHLKQYPKEIPLLYCSNLTITDEHLTPIKKLNLIKREPTFYNALVEGCTWGCTSVINQAAYKLIVSSLPKSVIFHDWWFYLVVSAFGKIIYDEKSMILYRRHSQNNSNVITKISDKILVMASRFLKYSKLQPVRRQAEEFYQIFNESLEEEFALELNKFISSRDNLLTRLSYVISCPFYRQSRLDTIIIKLLSLINRL